MRTGQAIPPALAAKRAALERILEDLGSVVIAYSGGVDSTLLLAEACRVLGRRHVLAVTATGELLAPGELDEARAMARRLGARHKTIKTRQLHQIHFRKNPPDRCYHCKKQIFGAMADLARVCRTAAVCDGANADDAKIYRPGMRAIAELGVRSPLKEAGFAKADVRAMSRILGLPTWNRPAMPCLATRFPYGRPITAAGLRRVAAAEEILKKMGFCVCRVRDHGTVALIEVDPDEIDRAADRREGIVRELKAIGYSYVALDLEGYRSGAMDEVLTPKKGRRTERGSRKGRQRQ